MDFRDITLENWDKDIAKRSLADRIALIEWRRRQLSGWQAGTIDQYSEDHVFIQNQPSILIAECMDVSLARVIALLPDLLSVAKKVVNEGSISTALLLELEEIIDCIEKEMQQ